MTEVSSMNMVKLWRSKEFKLIDKVDEGKAHFFEQAQQAKDAEKRLGIKVHERKRVEVKAEKYSRIIDSLEDPSNS
jgi:hypothetical protein